MLAKQNEVLEMIVRFAPLPETLDAITRFVEGRCVGGMCSILLVDETGTRLMRGATSSLPEAYSVAIDNMAIGPNEGSCGTAAYRKELVVVKDISGDPLWANYRDLALRHKLKACWSHPIVSHAGQLLGTLAMYYREPRAPDTQLVDTINTATSLACIAIERKKSQEILSRYVERFQTVARATNDAVWDWDLAINSVWWNEGYQTLFGYRLEDIKPGIDSWYDPIHPDDRERVFRGVHALIDSAAQAWIDEYRFRRRDRMRDHIVWRPNLFPCEQVIP